MRNKVLYILGIVALASCSDDVVNNSAHYLNGTSKTPIEIMTNISLGETSMTRAADGTFAIDDALKVYLDVVNEATPTAATPAEENNPHKGLYNLKINSATATGGKYPVKKSNGTDLYWDDFSTSEYDLRTENRKLRMFYGYCYNGGTPSPDLTETTGVLGWTVQENQNTTGFFQKSDLLFAQTGTDVANGKGIQSYLHGNYGEAASHNTLELPFSHAMSKVTIDVVCGDGFTAGSQYNIPSTATITLNGVQTKCTVTAPTGAVDPSTDASDIKTVTMQKGTNQSDNMSCTYTAIIAPTVFKAGCGTDGNFATLTNFGRSGSVYYIRLTDNILKTAAEDGESAWSTKLAAHNSTSVMPTSDISYTESDGGMTIPGVNYHLTVTLGKQDVDIVATIKDWDEVTAKATGNVKFTTDITNQPGGDFTQGTISMYKKGSAASIYQSTAGYKADYTYNTSEWGSVTPLYWNGEGDKSDFRAFLAVEEDGLKATAPSLNTDGTTVNIATGGDVIWGTTAKHTVTKLDGTNATIDEGASIDPRTKAVPMQFYHKMSQVQFIIENTTDESTKVEFSGAKMTIKSIATSGTLTVHSGEIAPGTQDQSQEYTEGDSDVNKKLTKSDEVKTTVDDVTTITTPEKLTSPWNIEVPQTISDDAELIIEVTKDSKTTKYSLKLKDCLKVTENSVSTTGTVAEWEPGKKYIYTISIGKEEILFRALIKDWILVETSGNATMDWDDDNGSTDLEITDGWVEDRENGWGSTQNN